MALDQDRKHASILGTEQSKVTFENFDQRDIQEGLYPLNDPASPPGKLP
ncbi:MAG: hypothetical protein ACLUHA_11460 [Bacteroides stercoris]